jgi:hypothetical protein
MAASPHDYITTVELEIDNPASFIPTTLCQRNDELLWIGPAYATYRGTPVTRETIESSFLCDRENVELPPNMEKISQTISITDHQREYIEEYKFAAATLDHWCLHKYDNDQCTVEAINNWKTTCDKLTQNPFFNEDWKLPAFYPLYSYQCMAGMQNFYADSQISQPDKKNFWKNQLQLGNEMFRTWEETYIFATAPKHVPFPKCLWLHKYLYIHSKRQPNTWRDFFEGTDSFRNWGQIN